MNTLMADDDALSRLLLRSALKKLGHDVPKATHGRDAARRCAWLSVLGLRMHRRSANTLLERRIRARTGIARTS